MLALTTFQGADGVDAEVASLGEGLLRVTGSETEGAEKRAKLIAHCP
jgi:hypothetical protein